MPIPEHVQRLRSLVGTELLLLPSVSVLVRDDHHRVVLVRHADSGTWGLVGGAVEIDEEPEEAAAREAREETGLEVRITGIVTVLGGPRYRVRYPNGDETAYVMTVYSAEVTGGTMAPDGDETIEVAWFAPQALAGLALGPLARATFEHLDWLGAGDGDGDGAAGAGPAGAPHPGPTG